METCDWAKKSARLSRHLSFPPPSPPPPLSLHSRRFSSTVPKGGLLGSWKGLRVGPPNASRELFEAAQFPLCFLFFSLQAISHFSSSSTVFPEPIDISVCLQYSAPCLVFLFPLHHLNRPFTYLPVRFLHPGHQASAQTTQRSRWIFPSRPLYWNDRTSSRKIDCNHKIAGFSNLIAESPSLISSIRQISIPLRSRDLHVQIRFPSGSDQIPPSCSHPILPHPPSPDQFRSYPKEVPLKISDYILFPGKPSSSFLDLLSFSMALVWIYHMTTPRTV